MMCALNFVFNVREISLPGKTVCNAMIWITGFLSTWPWYRAFLHPWTNHVKSACHFPFSAFVHL